MILDHPDKPGDDNFQSRMKKNEDKKRETEKRGEI